MIYELYGGNIKLDYNDKNHVYKVDGEKVPGCTTILSVINKPAIPYWAAGVACDYIAEKWKPGYTYDELEITTTLQEARKEHTKKKEQAATIGSLVHQWVHEYIKWRLENE